MAAKTKSDLEAQIARLDKDRKRLQDESIDYYHRYAAEQKKVEKLKQKLATFEMLDQAVVCFAKQRVVKDAEAVQLGLDEILVKVIEKTDYTGKVRKDEITRTPCATVEEAIEQIFSDFDEALERLERVDQEELDDLREEREKMLRALGLDEFEWEAVEWRY